jgi:hypothetical protein
MADLPVAGKAYILFFSLAYVDRSHPSGIAGYGCPGQDKYKGKVEKQNCKLFLPEKLVGNNLA